LFGKEKVGLGIEINLVVTVKLEATVQATCTYCGGTRVRTLTRNVTVRNFPLPPLRYAGWKGAAKIVAKLVPGLNVAATVYEVVSLVLDSQEKFEALLDVTKIFALSCSQLESLPPSRRLLQTGNVTDYNSTYDAGTHEVFLFCFVLFFK